MAVRPADVRAIVERVCARPEVLDACARGNLGTVIDALRTGGLTQGRISGLTGIPQGRLSEWNTGKREPRGISTFQKFADGVGMPPAARRALGLDSEPPPAAPASSPDLSMPYPDTPADATRNASQLWLADLSDATALQRGRADPRAWNDASLRWLVDPGRAPGEPARGVGIGMSDVERFRVTVDMFARLDDQFGGGHARPALIQYLSTDADRMLHGKYNGDVGRALFAAVGEAMLLAAWMSYDSAPASALAQGYFVQALTLAQAGQDRMLGASILDAMSHQATFTGRYTEAATLSRAALNGTRGMATPTLTAHFHAMEARALARLHDAKACGHALAESMREFERSNPQNDPVWIRYFNESDDPSFWARAGAVCRLYLNPPPGTVLISIDEKTGIQAKTRTHPDVSAGPGRDIRREFEYVRHGTVSVIAAMNVTTGEVIAQRIRRNDSVTFMNFLAMLDQGIAPGLRIHLIMDNGSSHTSKATRAWIAAHPRFAATYTPKHASWLNMIEQWFIWSLPGAVLDVHDGHLSPLAAAS